MVVMFREPLTHCASLLEKHLQYSKLQQNDSFVLEYMNWLGHHEFGLNQKIFRFSEDQPPIIEEKSSIDYWLKCWIHYYQYVLTINRKNVILVKYSDYCQNPNKRVLSIYDKLGINLLPNKFNSHKNMRKNIDGFSSNLYNKALTIFNELEQLAINSN